MAEKSKTVEIIFGGVDKVSGTITTIGRSLDSLESRVGNVTGPLAGIADSILKLDAALVAAGAAMLAFATKEAVQFEAALIDLQKVLGDGEGEASDYGAQFSEMASRFGVSASAIIQSTADFRQAGFDINDSLTLVEQSLLAVNAADLTTTQSSELLIGTLAGFKAPASEAARLLDVLNGVSNNAGASVEQLGDGFKILSPVAKALGLSFEETAALLTPVVEVTRSGSESANALKTAISNLIKPTKERKELLEDELGIQLEVNGERRNTKDVLYDLIAATQNLDDNEKQRVATVIAGAEQMSRFLAVIDGAKRSEEILKIAVESSGSALAEFETKTSSAEFALRQLQSAFGTAAATAGLEYIDQTKAVTSATTNLVDSFRDAISGDNADVLFSALRAGLDAFAEQIDTIATNLPAAFEGLDFSDLLRSFGDLGDEVDSAFKALFGDIDLSTVEGLETALQAVVDAITALVDVSGGIISGLEPLFRAIATGVSEFNDLDSSTQKTVGELLGLSKTIDTILPVIGGLGSGLEAIGTGLTALAGAQGFKALTSNLESVKNIGAGAGKFGLIGAALLGTGAAGYGIGTLLNEYVIDPLQDKFGGSIGTWLADQFNPAEVEKIGEQLTGIGDAARETGKETESLRELNARLDAALRGTAQAAELDIAALQSRADELVKNSKSQTELVDGLGEFTDAQKLSAGAIQQVNEAVSESGKGVSELSSTTEELARNNKSLQISYDESTGKINSWSGTIIRAGESIETTAKQTDDAIKKSEEFYLALEKLASDERIANIDAQVRLDIAEVEAGAEKVKALAETIGSTFEDTGSLIGSLFGDFGDASRSDQIEISKQIRLENERRDAALKLQEKLTEAQIENIRAQTRAMADGGGTLKISADGLSPHLEAFMFEILENIQLRVNAQGGAQLLGLI